jgi:hypothetical protein
LDNSALAKPEHLAQLVKPETIAICVATLLPSRRPADKISAGRAAIRVSVVMGAFSV